MNVKVSHDGAAAQLREFQRSEAWLAGQRDAFRAAVSGADLCDSLGILVRTAVEQTEGAARCGFWIADESRTGLYHVIGLDDYHARRLAGFPIGEDSLACGLAAARGEAVITADVQEDERWTDWIWLAEEFGYRAIWSFPVVMEDGSTAGSFSMYFEKPRAPTSRDIDLSSVMTQAAAIIISRKQQAEARDRIDRHRQALIGELQHRTSNLIGLVQTIANLTLDRSDSIDHFRAHFTERLQALGRVQRLLSRLGEGDRLDFDELLRTELTACGALDGHADRVSIEGPKGVQLRSRMVQILALALHELATNAGKYGALNQPQARLAVRWALTGSADDPWLRIDWVESGVTMPASALPQGTGQGRELIEQALPYQIHARTSFELGSDGVRCSIEIPVPPPATPYSAGALALEDAVN